MFVDNILPRINYDIKTYRNHRKEKTETSSKLKVLAGSIVGTTIPLLFIAKRQNKNIFNVNYGLQEILSVSAGGVLGGVTTGLFVSKKGQRKQKVNEGVFQFLNSTIPPILAGGMVGITKKIKFLNSTFYKLFSSFVGLVGGIILASKLTNKINDPQDKKPDRKFSIKDSVANIDDAIGTLIIAKVPFVNKLKVNKILPLIYTWCGYRSGVSN